MRRWLARSVLAAAAASGPAASEAACLRPGDLGLAVPGPAAPEGLVRVKGGLRKFLLGRAAAAGSEASHVWVAHAPPYLILTMIYVKDGCLVRAEQMSLRTLIEQYLAPRGGNKR